MNQGDYLWGHPSSTILHIPWSDTGSPFIVILALSILACVGLALFYCTREHVIRLGYKQAAWTFALVLLTLFGLAMNEVGNSLVVRDQAMLCSENRPLVGIHMIQQGERFLATCGSEVTGFRVDQLGRIRDMQRTPLSYPLPSGQFAVPMVVGLAVNESGQVVVTYPRYRSQGIPGTPSNWKLEAVCRTTFSWPGVRHKSCPSRW